MPITNQSRHPNVRFFSPDAFRVVGDVGGTNLVWIGKEDGTGDPVVAKSYTENPAKEDLFAVPLSELLSHTQEKISITQQL